MEILKKQVEPQQLGSAVVNDLILRNSDSSGAKTKYHLTPEAIAEWAEKWRARF